MEANPDIDVVGPGRELERHLRRPQHARRVGRPARHHEPQLLRQLRRGRPAVHGRGDRLAGGPGGLRPDLPRQLQVRRRRVRRAGPRQRPALLLQPGHPRGRRGGAPPPPGASCWRPARPSRRRTPGIIPLALPLGPEEAQAEFLIWTGGNGGAYFRDGEWVINSAENLETLEFLQQLVDNGCTQPNPGTTDRTAGALPALRRGRGGHDQRLGLPPRRARERRTRAT